MISVGITGNFASGKSFVLNSLANEGYKTLSADVFVKNLYKNKEIQKKILKILPNLGVFNKQKIAEIIYNDEKARIDIENFIHPLVLKGIIEFKEHNKTEEFIFIEVPLLFEVKWEKNFNFIITTYCPEETRLERAKTREGFNQELYNKLVKTQLSQNEKIKRSDFIINTDGKMLELKPQIINILEKLKCL